MAAPDQHPALAPPEAVAPRPAADPGPDPDRRQVLGLDPGLARKASLKQQL